MSDLAISIWGLGKSYQIQHGRPRTVTFRDVVMDRLRHPLRRNKPETFWALRGVDLEIVRGDVLGVIGRNGAGKSTLLKLLSRITEPTEGVIDLYGRVGSLLEVGTGFHPELTGRENIFLNGAILGMRRSEIRRQFDAIVDFAEVEKFLDTPVKRYSSGMYVRLAFAVAAHLDPEILIVDEVLAVGDAQFQNKCLGKMGEVARSGRTVILVSHNMAAVQNLCKTAIFLKDGQIVEVGPTPAVVARYVATGGRGTGKDVGSRSDRTGTGEARCVGLLLLDVGGSPISRVKPFEPFDVEIAVHSRRALEGVTISVDLDAIDGTRITTLYSGFHNSMFRLAEGRTILRCSVRGLPLRADSYVLNVWIGDAHCEYDFVRAAHPIEVEDTDLYGTGRVPARAHGQVLIDYSWSAPDKVREREALRSVSEV